MSVVQTTIPKYPLFFEVGYVSSVFQITAKLSYLNFISVNSHKNQSNFFGRQVGREGGREVITTRFARLLAGEGRRSQCMRLPHSFASGFSRLASGASAQNVQDQSFKQKGLGVHGFGTERARLVVQVERLRCTRLRHRTCKTSGSSQKKGLLPMGISFFFLPKYPNFENSCWILFFFHLKKF